MFKKLVLWYLKNQIKIKIFLATYKIYKPEVIDEGIGDGLVKCPICKNTIKIQYPNTFETPCPSCKVILI